MKRLLIAAFVLMLAAPVAAQQQNWIGVWGAPPSPPAPTSRSFNNQTIRQVLHLSAGGQSLRVRFTNEYGTAPLKIGGASIALVGANGTESAPIPLTFGGQPNITVAVRAPMYSDPVAINLPSQANVAIRLYLPEASGPCTCHPQATSVAQIFAGDTTRGGAATPSGTFANRAFISNVEVQATSRTARTIVTFGDSITDGTRSTNDANARWHDVLAARLAAAEPRRQTGVVNAAISGNQVLALGSVGFGDSALSRMDRDLFSVPGVTHMTLLEGINDLGMNRDAARPTAEQIIAGYRQIIARAHAHNIKIIASTLLPYEGAAYYSEEGEGRRQQVNQWIRTSGAFDGIIDFDAIMRDPANPKRLKADQQSGDWLHPNDAGYKVMGEAIDLRLFR